MFTVDPETKIGANSDLTLWGEIQNESDDIFKWIHYDRDINSKAFDRFKQYIGANFAEIQFWLFMMGVEIDSPDVFL